VQGLQAHTQTFWFVENLGKITANLSNILKIQGKIPEKPNKTPKYLGKIPENLGNNGAQRLKKNMWRPFFGGHTKKRPAKAGRQLFGQVWENWAKILFSQINLLAPTPMNAGEHSAMHLISTYNVVEKPVMCPSHFCGVRVESESQARRVRVI